MQRKKAFTLIELLVVIAIIGLLLAIIVPALRFAKRQATGAVCLANVYGLSKAWHTYSAENDGKLVNGHTPRSPNYNNLSSWTGNGYLDNAWWVNPPHDENGVYTGEPLCTLEDEERGIMSGALYPYTESPDVYHCPGSRHYLSKDANRRGGKRSYSMFAMMNGEMSGTDRENQPAGDWRMASTSMEIKTPGSKIVFVEDTDARGWNMGSFPLWNANDWTDDLAIFHIDRGSLGFADGHAEMHHWRNESTIYNAEHILDDPMDYPTKPVIAGEDEDFLYMKRAYAPK